MPERLSLLRWAGGKSRVIGELEAHFRMHWTFDPKKSTFWEPFCGGGAVTLMVIRRFRPARVVCGDVNQSLIDFYVCLRDSPGAFMEALKGLPDDYNANRGEYNRLKAELGASRDTCKVAALFYYLNCTGFNGVYRENQKGELNVNVGDRVFCLPEADILQTFVGDIQGVEFVATSFESFMDRMIGEFSRFDLCYCDSPYDKAYTSYSSSGFGRQDQQKLHEMCSKAAMVGGRVITSNNETDFVRALYAPPCVMTTLRARSSVNPRHPGKRDEVLITFPVIPNS